MSVLKVLMVCLGNICRSPAAQGILAFKAKQHGILIELDSAGTADYHVGNKPDSRSISALLEVGIDIAQQRARKVTKEDFYVFDWIMAMDQANLDHLRKIQPADSPANLVMFGEFSDNAVAGEVNDPYYGKEEDFIIMRQHLELMSDCFIDYLSSRP